jgi:hypothetical protein
MGQNAIFWPAAAQALLTVVILLSMGPVRARSMRENRTTYDDIALGQPAWSETATKFSNNYKNQFELPVLFYAVCALALAAKVVDPLLVGLAWAFVAARVAHALIHVTYNKVPHRATAFFVSIVLVIAMWLSVASRV